MNQSPTTRGSLVLTASVGRMLTSVLGLVLCTVAVWAIHRIFRDHSINEVMIELRTRSPLQMILAVTMMVSSYLVLTGYDLLGLHYIQRNVSKPRAMLTSFLGYAFANNVGFFGGAGLRLRRYLVLGLSPYDIGKLVAFSAMTFWIGFAFLGGSLFLLMPPKLPNDWFTQPILTAVGVCLLGFVLLYLVQSRERWRNLRFRGRSLVLPDFPTRVAQIGISSCDWLFASAVLYFVLPGDLHIAFPLFAASFLCAQMLGLASNVPGGVGVFESILVYMLPIPAGEERGFLASLILYRAIYFVAPLIVATCVTAFIEVRHHVLAARGRVRSKSEVPEAR